MWTERRAAARAPPAHKSRPKVRAAAPQVLCVPVERQLYRATRSSCLLSLGLLSLRGWTTTHACTPARPLPRCPSSPLLARFLLLLLCASTCLNCTTAPACVTARTDASLLASFPTIAVRLDFSGLDHHSRLHDRKNRETWERKILESIEEMKGSLGRLAPNLKASGA